MNSARHFLRKSLSLTSLLIGLLALTGGGGATAQDDATPEGEAVAIETAKLIVEYNATDGDLGVHGAFDGEPWTELRVYGPDGTEVLAVEPDGELGELGVGGIFFESREPVLAEFSFDDLAARFPEGEYEVRGATVDGAELTGTATFSHAIPEPPTITTPALADDEEQAGDAAVPADELAIEWEDVTTTVDGDPATITAYEVIVTKVDHDDPRGFSRPIFDVHLPPDRNRLTVPPEFLEPGTLYELEVLALEESGNQTISVGFFETEAE